ncbi:MAG TPA: hypothetical protein PLV73_04400 [Treponemataceae bacterium]|nr:hypothetical protein [Treponemataceae bacterium]HPX14434.1 hypothetical protein [Treponemataceae bacterium]
MEQTMDFTDQLFQALTERQKLFDSYLLPKMHEDYRIAHSAVKTVKTVLVKKGFLYDDPYKYDSKTSEIQIPDTDEFGHDKKSAIVGSRLAQYEAMVDFLNNSYQFSCDFITTDRIALLVKLNQVFSWESFSPTSTNPNTRALAEVITTLRSGTDPLSISIVNDALSQLSKTSLSITRTLKSLTEFHRERYKVAVRKLVMPGVIIDPDKMTGNVTSILKDIKQSFALSMKGQPFYTELIEEILKEDYSPDHAVLQQQLLTRIAVSKKTESGTPEDQSLKPVLLDGIRTLGAVSPQLDEIVDKLTENRNILLSSEKGLFEKIARLVRKAFNLKEEEETIAITTVDPISQATKREIVDFLPFVEGIRHRSRILTGFTVKTSAAYQKIEMMDEQQILDLLTRHIAELNTIVKQCAGLDAYFKQSAQADARNRIRGVKVEISAIRNNLVKANQCRAEYAAQVEEQQQLKKLGITNG